MIEVQPTMYTVRFFNEGDPISGPFCAVCTVQRIGWTTCYVSAFHGKITRQHLREAAQYGADLGLKFVLMHRRGRIKQVKIERYL